MGVIDGLRGRLPAGADRAPSDAGARPVADDGAASLRRRREELVAQVAELHWDLGGLAYEMAIRDHFRLDVLVRKAAELKERDAELGELERVLSLQENAGAGECPSCGAVRSRGAPFCWQCGSALMEHAPSAAANGAGSAPGGGGERPEAPIDGERSESPIDSARSERATVVLPPGTPGS
jgi:hypothetical protein